MKTTFFKSGLVLIALFFMSIAMQAQSKSKAYYNSCAGQNVIYKDYERYSESARSKKAKDAKRSVSVPKAEPSSGFIQDVKLDEEAEAMDGDAYLSTYSADKANVSTRTEQRKDEKTGKMMEVQVQREKVNTDAFGNAHGNDFDLAVDGAFKGETIAVLQLYDGTRYGENFDFEDPKKALAEKGFSVYRWIGNAPSPEELRAKLKKSCQLWVISDETRKLTDEHLEVIKEFFDSGKGLYIWGDNTPFYADANFVGAALLDITMEGNLWGDQTVNLKEDKVISGIRQNHLITTGMNYVYEGITIATIAENEHLTPLIWGSAGNLVTSVYDKDGKRAIFDGGFTRLYNKWDTAGTGRYVKNAAAWLTNVEGRDDDLAKGEEKAEEK